MTTGRADVLPVTLSMQVQGLATRDETVFKSFVRLVAHRTAQRWVFTEGAADVRVVPSDAPQPRGADEAVLVVGATDRTGHAVSLPIHANELESALDRLGSMILARRDTRRPAGPVPGTFRLRRWPPAELVRTPERLRLATLMTGRVLSLAQLQHHSGQALATCEAFVADLQRAGALAVEAATPVASPVPATSQPRVQPGLLSRIRNRLGLLGASRP